MASNKILVVDDEARMRKLIKDFLTAKDYVVLEAANGQEALDIFNTDTTINLCNDASFGWMGYFKRNTCNI